MGIHVGLDIGIASVGWCVVDNDGQVILGMGVRTFKKAEDPKSGDSLARPRRLARSARRRLRRRHTRMQRLRDLLVSEGVVSREQLASVFVVGRGSKTPYELRAEGLDRRLSAEEWARVLSQLCKRRGYRSMRLSEQADDDEGAVKEAIALNTTLMREKGYRTVGEMLARDERFADHQRNRGDYKGVVTRRQLLDEIETLFATQRHLGNPHASAELEAAYTTLLTWQAPITEGEELRALVGMCSLNGANTRIASACPTFERFRVVDKLFNVRYTCGTSFDRLPLTDEQRQAVIEKAFSRQTPISYADIRRICELPDDVRFVGVRYSGLDPDDLSAEKKEKLPSPKAWHEMRKRVKEVSPEAWQRLVGDADLLDRIAEVLNYYKLEASVTRELIALGLEDEVIGALSGCRFSGNGHLSRETLLGILPFMESGLPYSEACREAGFHHSQKSAGERHEKLPAIPPDEVRNPVVLRALSQTRKVLNAIIDAYGPIEELHIELGRDVGRSFQDRRKIEREQKKHRAEREGVLEQIQEDFGVANPAPHDRLKLRLWKEQGGHCAYSGVYIDPQRMLSGEPGVAEVDHVLPHSRSFDNGYMNKVLVTAVENQRKGDRTPFEYMGHDEARWHEFEELVRSLPFRWPKKQRLLRRQFDEKAAEEYRERNLVDTRYIARYFKDFAEQNLHFSGDGRAPVVTVNGRATAYLRTGWRLQKVRAEGDLHHALDAAVVAVANRSMVQTVSRFFSARSLRTKNGEYVDPTTGEVVVAKHVPEPWEGFREEVAGRLGARFGTDPLTDLTDESVSPRPILVSRMPRRTVRGEIHKETVRRIEGEDAAGRIRTSKKVRLEQLTPAMLERMVGKQRDGRLYEALRTRLEEYDGDGAKAFAKPFVKPTRSGREAPRVRSIRIYGDPASGGVEVRGGLAGNGVMVRTDVFEKDGGFFLVPVYLEDVALGRLPQKACVAGKAESHWRPMDEAYAFRFSLYLNDLVRLVKRNRDGTHVFFGYYRGMNRSDATIKIEAHDSAWEKGSLGVQRAVAAFGKLEHDILGQRVFPVRREKRRGFPVAHHSQ